MRGIGILGTNYVARMIGQAASQFAIPVRYLAQRAEVPNSAIHLSFGDWSDAAQVKELMAASEFITTASDLVDAALLRQIESLGGSCAPSSNTIDILQDRLLQKRTMQQAAIGVGRFRKVSLPTDVLEAAQEFGFPLLVRSRHVNAHRTQELIRRAAEIQAIVQRLAGHELLVEAPVNAAREISVTVIRGWDGDVRTYPVVEIVRSNHRIQFVRCPAPIDEALAHRATEAAVKAVQAVEGVGAFSIELFEVADNEVVFSDITPGPQSTGFYTLEGCITSHSENHVRAVMGIPLGDTFQIAPATSTVMISGEASVASERLKDALATGGAHIHLYGDAEMMPGNQIGHITVLGYDADGAEKVGRLALSRLIP